MSASPVKITKRLEYAPPLYKIDTVRLSFSIGDGLTSVESVMTLRARTAVATTTGGFPSLVLHRGKDVDVKSVAIGGSPVPFTTTPDGLEVPITLEQGGGGFTLTTVSHIVPEKNTELEGLYRSSEGMYCTQCEAEGFRSITPFIDRPDNLSTFTVRVEAARATCPVLLSNGDCMERGEAAGGRHYAVWVDPFPKPAYLFALVAGDLVSREESYTTVPSGKPVALKLWTKAHDWSKGAWAMESIKKAMAWDERRFGLEYDLSEFNVVAVSDFNMGAMENKSLNIFNSRLVMATPTTATDVDFGRIEGVIGHEYFHNWTGNRVTCQDWFQLTLKEGLTVYRDQEFSMDMNSRPVKRIEDVSTLRRSQFSEDSGPMAHPIRPDEYQAINNFYSATVYEKGAEIIRIYATLLGTAGFRAGMDLYFKRHDGAAVTCDDFFAAMADANKGSPAHKDMGALHTWYSQAGTPILTLTGAYDAAAMTYTLHAKQRTPPTPGEAKEKAPVLIPISVGLLGPNGADMPLTLAPGTPGEVVVVSSATGAAAPSHTAVLRMTQGEQTFVFSGLAAAPVASLLRGFSAPVKCTLEGQSEGDLIFLLANDSDPFNRFEAGQKLGRSAVLGMYAAAAAALGGVGSPALQAASSTFSSLETRVASVLDAAGGLSPSLISAFEKIIRDPTLDGSFVSRAITFPAESELMEALDKCDPVLLCAVRGYAVKALARGCAPALSAAISRVEASESFRGEFSPVFSAAALRALRNKAYSYLAMLGEEAVGGGALASAATRAAAASNMTDEIGALACIIDCPPGHPVRTAALTAFASKWGGEPLVMLKWLALQAMGADGTSVTQALAASPTFNIKNPNSCYNLFGVYASNAPAFHAIDGSGYSYLADTVLALDAINPQVAARIVGAFNKIGKVDSFRAGLIKAQLTRMRDTGKLSENVGEIVDRALR